MLETQGGAEHPGRRLWQLEGVSGRGLLTRGSTACGTAPHYVTISLRGPASGTQGDPEAWQLVYRSEAVGGTLNPDWQPLPWGPGAAAQPDPLLHSSQAEVLLALHTVLGDADDPGEASAHALLPAPSGESLASEEQLAAAYEPPASLAAALEGLQRPVLYAPDSRPAVCLAAGDTGAAAAAARPAEEEQQDDGKLVPHQQQVTDVENGHCPVPMHPPAEEQRQQQLAFPQGSQSSASEDDPLRGQQKHSLPGERGGHAIPASPATAPAAAEAQGWQGAAEALAATGCCPGRLVAAWQAASLGALWPAGADLAAVRQPLQPNTLVLRFGDGLFLCPPPAPPRRAARPASHQTSPLKHAAAQAAAAVAAEGGEGGAGGPGATRRFANLLVSRLLRSAPNLQEAEAALDGGATSDAESDAGSDGAAATAADPGRGAGLAGGRHAVVPLTGGSKVLTVAGAYQYITSLAAMRGRLRDLAGRATALQQQLEHRLAPHRQHAAQQQQLAALRGEAARCAAAAAAARAQLGEVAAEAESTRKLATTRAQALVTTLKVMQAAERRLGEAEASLQGEGVRGAAAAVLRELVARRCQMVAQLGSLFQLGPTQVSVPEAPPGGYLEDRLEQQWAGAGASSSAPSATSSGLGGATPPWGPARQEMRLSIAGLELRSAVWRAAFEEGVGAVEPEDDRDAAVALGYLAQVVDRLAAYLDVPLRYPLLLRGSRSAVVDSNPPVGTWLGEGGASTARRPLLGPRGEADGAGGARGAGEAPASYPLYCEAERDRPRFAVGVFLLNKDVIQLLQAHGISAGGPTHLLQNVYKLVLAAQSGLPRAHLPPPGGQRA